MRIVRGFLCITVLTASMTASETLFLKEYPEKEGNFFSRFFTEFIEINTHLFTPQVLVAATSFVPWYVASRNVDYDLHSCFYDATCHQNINQLPRWVNELSGKGTIIPLVAFSSLSVFSRDVDLRITSSIFWKGVLSIWMVKNIIKNTTKGEFCCRPPCGEFKKKKYYGGFPSGHVAETFYMATLYGLQEGVSWGLPLWAYASFVAGVSVTNNRHYVSQVVGGAALGTLYALASHQVVEEKKQDYHYFIEPSHDGGFKAGIEYAF